MSGSRPAFIFDFEWRTTLFVLLLTPLMLSLGFWQLQRADEKAALAASFDARQLAGPRPLSTLWEAQGDELAYAPVAFEGRFLPTQYLLLDNRIQGGKFGYEVVGILVLEEGGSVLVNRGWIAGDASRQILPDVPVVHGKIEVRGHVYVSPGQPYLLGEQAL
jgi:cytochrome oxidase assembly protein ShyY1